MAKKRASNKRSTGSQPPPFPKDPTIGRQPPSRSSASEGAVSKAARLEQFDINQRLREDTFAAAKGRPSMSNSARRAMENRITQLDRQIEMPRTRVSSSSRGPDPMVGRTVETGTRSFRDAMVRFMRGGGGSLLRGK